MESEREDLIIQITEEYKYRRLMGEKPDLQDYLDANPEVAKEVRADIEAWEQLHEMAGTWEFLAALPSAEETLAAIRPRLEQTKECLDTKELCAIIQRGKDQLSAEEKAHLSECELCRERLTDLLLKVTAYTDSYIWDEEDLETVPESVMQKMQEAAQKWCSDQTSSLT